MANIKFSAFTQKVVTGNVDFLVGYTGADNVRISPAIFSDTYLPLAGGTMVGNTLHDDDVKSLYGASDDLSIYHSGSDSYIRDLGAGSLRITASKVTILNAANTADMIDATESAGVELYYDGVKKWETASTGIVISGVNALNSIESYFDGLYTSGFKFSDLNGGIWYDAGSDDLTLNAGHANSQMILVSGGAERMRIDSAGNVGIGSDTPTAKLQLKNTAADSVTQIAFTNDARTYNAGIHGGLSDSFNIYDITAGATRFLIDSSGNVGINTTSPVNNMPGWAGLTLSGTTGGQISFQDDGTSIAHIYNGTDFFTFEATSGNYMKFLTSSTERMRIDTSGNVGIGTASPTAKLQLESTSAGAATVAGFLVNSSTTLNTETRLAFAAHTNSDIATDRYSYISALNSSGSNGQDMVFATNATGAAGTEKMRIDSAGNVGIGGAAATDGNFQVKKAGVDTGITNVLINASFSEAAGSLSGLSIGYRTDETTAVLAPRTATGNLAFYNYDGGWSESMRITNTGYVGIGTDSPSRPLSVNSSQISARFTSSSADSQIEVVDSSGTVVFGSSSSSAIVQAGGAERMRVTSTGIVQVNPTNASIGGIVNSYRAAISVSTSAIAISNPATYGGLASVWVNSAGNIAHDLVSYSLSGIDVVASQPISGAAAARTYTAVSGVLKVAMAAGTYDVYATEIRVSLT